MAEYGICPNNKRYVSNEREVVLDFRFGHFQCPKQKQRFFQFDGSSGPMWVQLLMFIEILKMVTSEKRSEMA